MARPVTRRPTVRVGVAPPTGQNPGVDVAAPLNVRTGAPEVAGLNTLLNALGVAGELYGARTKAVADHDFKQGQADEKLGKADMAKAKKSRAYADGAFQVAILEQYQQAERKVAERSATDELDKTLPLDQQVAIVDGWMKSELGPLISDERAKLLIAERYQTFVESFAGNVLKAQAEQNAAAAEEVALADIAQQVERTGSFNWDEQFKRLHSQTGDATRSNALLVGIIAQEIENRAMRGEDYEDLRALVPTEVLGPNGEKLPGPMYSPKYRGIINTALARAEGLRDHALRQSYAAAEYKARVRLDEDLANGVPITEDSIAGYGFTVGSDPSDHLPVAVAAQYIQSSQLARAKKNEKEAEADSYLDARAVYGSWANAIAAPGGPASHEKAQKAYDAWAQLVLTGSGVPIEALAGNGLVSNPELVDQIANLSAQEGLPYSPLKHTLSSISQAAPGDVTARLDAYKVLKAKGVAGQYVDDESALIFEVAIGAQEAGEDTKGVAERIRTMGDKTTKDYVASQMQKVRVRKSGYAVPTGGGFLVFGDEVRSTSALNAGYLAAKYERLTASALSKGLSLEDAERYAKERVRDTHLAINVQGQWAVLPRSAVPSPKELAEAMDWYETQLPTLAKRLKVPPEEPLQVRPAFDINGRGLSFEVTRQGGVGTGVMFTAKSLIDTFRQHVPKVDAKAAAIDKSKRLRAVNATPIDTSIDLNPASRAGRE